MKRFMSKKPEPQLEWHVDFRDEESLPDVKPVRTSFFINGVSILVLTIVTLFLAVKEFQRHMIHEEIVAIQEKIAENSARNKEVLRLDSAFKSEARYINGVVDYLNGSLELSSLLVALADTLHPEMSFTSIRYQDRGGREGEGKELVINGTITARPDAAASVVTQYVDALQEDPFLSGRIKEAAPTALVPTQDGDKMAFGIQIVLQGNQKEGAKKE